MSKAFASQADLEEKKVSFTRLSDNVSWTAATLGGLPPAGFKIGATTQQMQAYLGLSDAEMDARIAEARAAPPRASARASARLTWTHGSWRGDHWPAW